MEKGFKLEVTYWYNGRLTKRNFRFSKLEDCVKRGRQFNGRIKIYNGDGEIIQSFENQLLQSQNNDYNPGRRNEHPHPRGRHRNDDDDDDESYA
jgi:hypothetical protein